MDEDGESTINNLKRGKSGKFDNRDYNNLLRLRSERSRKLSKFLEALICEIERKIPLIPLLKQLADLRYRSLTYHETNMTEPKPETDLCGIYTSERMSFSEAGNICRSAFYFRRNRWGHPVFKEKRYSKRGTKKYQIRTRGFWFREKNGYRLNGFSVEIPVGKSESEIMLKDIRFAPRFDDDYCFNDNGDPDTLHGFLAFIMKGTGRPIVGYSKLHRLPNQPTREETLDDDLPSHKQKIIRRKMDKLWDNIEDTDLVSLEHKDQRLDFPPIDNEYGLPIVKTNPDKLNSIPK